MAKLPEIAGLIADTLQLDPLSVHRNVEGLLAAGRIGDGRVSNAEAADLLCACVSTDQANATGPYHLSFAGAGLYEGDIPWIEAGTPEFKEIEAAFPTFGEAIAAFIDLTASGGIKPGQLMNICVVGSGDRLHASFQMRMLLFGRWCCPSVLYGYQPIGALIPNLAKRPGRVEVSHIIGPLVIERLALLMGAADMPERKSGYVPFHREIH